jgi:hypothetical protein
MGTSDAFEALTRALKRYETGNGEVKRVDAKRSGERESNEGLSATVDVTVPLCAELAGEETNGLSLAAASITPEGGLQVDFSSSALPTADRIDDERITVGEESASVENGTVVVTVAVHVDPDDGTEASELDAERETANQSDGSHSNGLGDASQHPDDREEGVDGRARNVTESAGERRQPECQSESETTSEGENDDNSGCDAEHGIDPERNEDLPPYEDMEYLEEIYDGCETFVEMAEAYERDVAAETVRRYMADAGVHEPSSYDTVSSSDDTESESGSDGGDADATPQADENATDAAENESTDDGQQSDTSEDENSEAGDPIKGIANQQIVADGVGLPEDLSIEQLADAVETSMTLYEVKRELELEQSKTRRLLKRLNLLDVVVTRLSEQDHREVSRSEIADRIRQSVS